MSEFRFRFEDFVKTTKAGIPRDAQDAGLVADLANARLEEMLISEDAPVSMSEAKRLTCQLRAAYKAAKARLEALEKEIAEGIPIDVDRYTFHVHCERDSLPVNYEGILVRIRELKK